MSFISALMSKTVANQCAHIDTDRNGLFVLHTVLAQLYQRLESTSSERLAQEAAVMRHAMAEVIEMAYSNFKAFSDKWECTVHYYDQPEKSNIFVFNFKEKCATPRSYNFRFAGLRGATTH